VKRGGRTGSRDAHGGCVAVRPGGMPARPARYTRTSVRRLLTDRLATRHDSEVARRADTPLRAGWTGARGDAPGARRVTRLPGQHARSNAHREAPSTCPANCVCRRASPPAPITLSWLPTALESSRFHVKHQQQTRGRTQSSTAQTAGPRAPPSPRRWAAVSPLTEEQVDDARNHRGLRRSSRAGDSSSEHAGPYAIRTAATHA
jgi:hypothetical protein